ncbi:MAG: clan AA aspartic protease [Burkholderiaceae bacterium]|jgi:aspartyl protease family protein|nr:retroviral-like aspartic protease family protein [Burkholderiaceae bacterium]MCP5289313.1 clan AA aspartic protease [Burkholderiaceae bacterium]HMQ73076.1 retropepsin-like aspartic protease [Rubrivivax sp.]
MHELPRTLKIATVWLLLATALFLAVQAFLAERQRPRVSTDGMGVIELRRAPDGHFHWPARLGGGEVDFLVDTGATRTALPQPLAERLGLPRGRAVRSSTAGGTVTGWESQVDLELAGGLQARALRVTVLPDLRAPLLGMDVLSRLRFTQHDGVLRLEPPG